MATREVYCFVCKKFITESEATSILKTGFFKINIPLAYCIDCTDKQNNEKI